MSLTRTYLDFNATAPLRDEARGAVVAAMDIVGNPSSVHAEGRGARAVISTAREQVANLIGADAREIVFTSGATESNNWVIKAPWRAIVTIAVEHDSILAPVREVGCPVHVIGVDANGVIDCAALEAVLGELLTRIDTDDAEEGTGPGERPVLVSVQAANGETGVVQPLDEVRRIVNLFDGALLHVDAVQVKARHCDALALGAPDFVSLSGHKIGGPKGVGALFVRAGRSLAPSMTGGGQELRRRPGTENVPAIAGFGAAAQAAASDDAIADFERLADYRALVEEGVLSRTPDAWVVAEDAERLCNTACIAVDGMRAETLVMALDLEGVAVSAGSACSSGKVSTSSVLRAMGLDDAQAASAIRVSFGWSSTLDDVERFLNAWQVVSNRMTARQSAMATTHRQIA